MKKILLVEDSEYFQVLTKKILGTTYAVTCVARASDAVAAIEAEKFDLILLDVMLPDGDGFLLCAQLRDHQRTKNVPVIFITAKTGVAEKITGFSLGAEDYIVKPFEPLELLARIQAKLKKSDSKEKHRRDPSVRPIEIDAAERRAIVHDRTRDRVLDLTPTEFSILDYLLKNENKVVSRDELGKVVWGHESEVGARTLDRHISFLRQKLMSKSSYIQTVSGSGYRLSLSAGRRKAA